jgi:hypothetical protein
MIYKNVPNYCGTKDAMFENNKPFGTNAAIINKSAILM